jgi:hypothetical protein
MPARNRFAPHSVLREFFKRHLNVWQGIAFARSGLADQRLE